MSRKRGQPKPGLSILSTRIREHHYNRIAELPQRIQRLDGWISYHAKHTLSADPSDYNDWHIRKMVEMGQMIEQRREAVELLQLLEEKWPKIFPVLREQSKILFALPRELREKVYGFLYTNPPVIEILYEGNMPPRYVFPHDPYLYLNPRVVDPVIAAEATQALYSANHFHIKSHSGMRMAYRYLAHFLHTDHFNNSFTPATYICKLTLSIPGRKLYHPTYADLEQGHPLSKKAFHQMQERKKFPMVEDMGTRRQLSALLDLAHLTHVVIRLTNIKLYGWKHVEYREIAPVLKTLKRRGVRMLVWSHVGKCKAGSSGGRVDVSDLFDEPSEQDWDVWGKKFFSLLEECEVRGWIKVWLALHFMEVEECM